MAPENPVATSPGPRLPARIRALRAPEDRTNLAGLAREYLTIAAVASAAVLGIELAAAGRGWAWGIPIAGLAIVLMGALQHRLAGLGHEALHRTLLANRLANDLVGDLFCMLPLLTSVPLYRAFHMAHHRHTNDPGLDPEVVHMGRSKHLAEFPMSRRRVLTGLYLAPLAAPASLIRYGWAYVYMTVLDAGVHPYRLRADGTPAGPGMSPAATLGAAYLLGLAAALALAVARGPACAPAAVGLAGASVVAAAAATLPGWAYRRSPFRQAYPARAAGALRLGYYTAVMAALATLHGPTAGRATAYALLLWAVPLGTSFLYFMRLRDIYQHANADADAGPLTSSRVFRCDPLVRWAVFVYGQDLHLTHHLFPSIPHHRLNALHELLRREHPEYAARVVECHGTFANRDGLPTIVETLTTPPGAAPTAPV